jgi:hypothetical protein
MNGNKNTILIIVVILLAIGAYFAFGNKKSGTINNDGTNQQGNDINNGSNNGSNNGTTDPDMSSKIVVTAPEGNSVNASTGFTVSGKAVGNWFFEASAPVSVYSKDGKLLVATYMTAQGDWMTTNFVPFKGEIPPFLTNGATEGYIQFENDNPSGNEGSRYVYKKYVTFGAQETQKIKLYFGNTIKNPNAANCSLVYAVERTVPKTDSIGTLALRTLLRGTTEAESKLGYTSAFDRGSGNELKSLTIKNGVATADFSFLPSAGSCLVGEARAQIEQTLKQFPTVTSVKILLNGSESEALQP